MSFKFSTSCVTMCAGLIQSSGWPTVVAIMGNWFGKSRYMYMYMYMYINTHIHVYTCTYTCIYNTRRMQ